MSEQEEKRPRRRKGNKYWCLISPDGAMHQVTESTRASAIKALEATKPYKQWKAEGWSLKRLSLLGRGDIREIEVLREVASLVLMFRECVETNRPGMSHMNAAINKAKEWRARWSAN